MEDESVVKRFSINSATKILTPSCDLKADPTCGHASLEDSPLLVYHTKVAWQRNLERISPCGLGLVPETPLHGDLALLRSCWACLECKVVASPCLGPFPLSNLESGLMWLLPTDHKQVGLDSRLLIRRTCCAPEIQPRRDSAPKHRQGPHGVTATQRSDVSVLEVGRFSFCCVWSGLPSLLEESLVFSQHPEEDRLLLCEPADR